MSVAFSVIFLRLILNPAVHISQHEQVFAVT